MTALPSDPLCPVARPDPGPDRQPHGTVDALEPVLREVCALCGGRLRPTNTGVPRRDARYCCSACRREASLRRRAAARADLVLAVDELAGAGARIERALQTLGLRPTKPRSHPRKEIP